MGMLHNSHNKSIWHPLCRECIYPLTPWVTYVLPYTWDDKLIKKKKCHCMSYL
jgi:hypothetical protein